MDSFLRSPLQLLPCLPSRVGQYRFSRGHKTEGLLWRSPKRVPNLAALHHAANDPAAGLAFSSPDKLNEYLRAASLQPPSVNGKIVFVPREHSPAEISAYFSSVGRQKDFEQYCRAVAFLTDLKQLDGSYAPLALLWPAEAKAVAQETEFRYGSVIFAHFFNPAGALHVDWNFLGAGLTHLVAEKLGR